MAQMLWQSSIVPEWRTRYIEYEKMKEKIRQIKKKRTQQDQQQHHALPYTKGKEQHDILKAFRVHAEDGSLKRASINYIPECIQVFESIQLELDKVNTFFATKEKELQKTHDKLVEQLNIYQKKLERHAQHPHKLLLLKQDQNALLSAWEEHYRSICLLKNYRLVNFTAGIKLVRFLDRTTSNTFRPQFTEHLNAQYFKQSKVVSHLLKDTKAVVSEKMFKGDKDAAMKALKLPYHFSSQPMDVFLTGLFAGICFIASVVWAYYYFHDYYPFSVAGKLPDYSSFTFYLFRAAFFPICLALLLFVNIYIWHSYKVNYVFIFEIDPRSVKSRWSYLRLGLFLYLLVLGLSLLFMFLVVGELRGEFKTKGVNWIIPIVMYGFLVLWLLLPFRILYGNVRYWLLSTLLRIACAPFVKVRFKDFWLADQLTSLGDFLFQIQFIYCIYPTNFIAPAKQFCAQQQSLGVPILNALPYWARFWQCIRKFYDTKKPQQLANAAKYFLSLVVILLAFLEKVTTAPHSGNIRIAWIVFNVLSSSYKFFWDIYMDWGLLSCKGVKYPLLRKTLMYPFYWYYIAVPLDFVIRFIWVVVLILRTYLGQYMDSLEYVFLLIIIIKLFRRFLWNIFRLEYEHLSNVDDFRAVREMPLPYSQQEVHFNLQQSAKTWRDKVKSIFICFYQQEQPHDLQVTTGTGNNEDDEGEISPYSEYPPKISSTSDKEKEEESVVPEQGQMELHDIAITMNTSNNTANLLVDTNPLPTIPTPTKGQFSELVELNQTMHSSNHISLQTPTAQEHREDPGYTDSEDEQEELDAVVVTHDAGDIDIVGSQDIKL